MTETEWATSTDYLSLEHEIYDKATARKSRLFACACCRLCWHLLPATCRRLVEAVERLADGEAELREVAPLFDGYYPHPVALTFLPGGNQAAEAVGHLGSRWRLGIDPSRDHSWSDVASVSRSAAEALAKSIPWDDARGIETRLLRCVFDSPFRPVTLEPEWRTMTVIQLAQHMYESRDFGTMPILADALQEADCDDSYILDHCRGQRPHVRGCWVVDLILSKS